MISVRAMRRVWYFWAGLALMALGCPGSKFPRSPEPKFAVDAEVQRECSAGKGRDSELAKCVWTKAREVDCRGIEQTEADARIFPMICVCNGCVKDEDCGDGRCVKVDGGCDPDSYVCVESGDTCWDPEDCQKEFNGMGICSTAGPFKARCVLHTDPP